MYDNKRVFHDDLVKFRKLLFSSQIFDDLPGTGGKPERRASGRVLESTIATRARLRPAVDIGGGPSHDENRRHAERVPYPCEVKCTHIGGLAIADTRLSDLSMEGVFVESVNELPVGTGLRLRFQVGSACWTCAATSSR